MYANPGLGTEGYCDGLDGAQKPARRSAGVKPRAYDAFRHTHSRWGRPWLLLFAALALLVASAPAGAAGAAGAVDRPSAPPTSAATAGSGIFGRWFVDGFGLPAYSYRLDPDRDARTMQPDLKSTDAWHQLGNDHIVATAHTRGHVQLWSQDRSYQWANLAQPAARPVRRRLRLPAHRRRPRDQHALRRPPGRGAHAARLRHRLLRPVDRGAGDRRDRAGLRAVRRRPAAAPRRHDPQPFAPPAAGELDRVLGRQPAQRGQPALHRARAARLRPPPAHADRPSAAGRGRQAAADGLRRRAARQGRRLGDRRHALLRCGRAGAARRGGRRTVVAHARRAPPGRHRGHGRHPGPSPLCLPFSDGRAARRLRDPPLRLRPGPHQAHPRAGQALARRARAARSQRARLARLAAARAPWLRPRLALARAPVGRLHAALGRDLRGDLRPPHHLPGRLLPVRRRHPGRLPRSAPAHPPADLRRPRAGARDDPLLGGRAVERPEVPALRGHRDVQAHRARHLGRPRPLAAARRGRVRARHARPLVLRRAPAVGGWRSRVALAPPAPGLPQPGEPPRPARRVPHRHERRLVRLLHAVPRHERVDPRHGPARLPLPATGRAGRRARRPRVRGAAAGRRRRAAHRARA